MKKLIYFLVLLGLYSEYSFALTSEEQCRFSLAEQASNMSKLRLAQKKLANNLNESDWIHNNVKENVIRLNTESFIGLDNLLIRRNEYSQKKDWINCNRPDFKYSSFEVVALISLAEANNKAVEVVNSNKQDIIKKSGCLSRDSCSQELYINFRKLQNDYSFQIIEEIETYKNKAFKDSQKTYQNKTK